jgi:hypothetical protein
VTECPSHADAVLDCFANFATGAGQLSGASQSQLIAKGLPNSELAMSFAFSKWDRAGLLQLWHVPT